MHSDNRVWSLWEMLEFYAERFVAAVDALATLGQHLHSEIERRDAAGKMRAELIVEPQDREHAKFLFDHLNALNLSVSAKAGQRLVDLLGADVAPANA